MADRRRAFGPVVLLGVAGAALAAVAGNRPWLDALGLAESNAAAVASRLEITTRQESPLAAALALVVLASWGVLLVSRGRFRRAVSWLALAAAVGLGAVTVSAPWVMADSLAAELRLQAGTESVTTTLTAWWWVALGAALLVLATTATAALLVASWPEMGARYDAPGAVGAAGDGGQPLEDNLDIWKALDEGRDPTA